jgi:hypothetical protein
VPHNIDYTNTVVNILKSIFASTARDILINAENYKQKPLLGTMNNITRFGITEIPSSRNLSHTHFKSNLFGAANIFFIENVSIFVGFG